MPGSDQGEFVILGVVELVIPSVVELVIPSLVEGSLLLRSVQRAGWVREAWAAALHRRPVCAACSASARPNREELWPSRAGDGQAPVF